MNATTRSRSEFFSIAKLAEEAKQGRLRVPEFQRSFRWEGSDVLALFDSILKGYPVGSVLLWKQPAPAARVTLGAMVVETPEKEDALWVVDGQQRITSLVNAVSPESFSQDDRFRLFYAVDTKRFVRQSSTEAGFAIPLPDLFDVARLLAWFTKNPDAQKHAFEVQEVTANLREFQLPGSVIEQAQESVLRDIFDRMNTAGKRLRSAEIFDAIHRARGDESGDDLSIAAIGDRLAATTTFGRMADAVVYQAILVRRHPDITRDPHSEFDTERRQASHFPGEDRSGGYKGGEEALRRAIHFLAEECGVPHVTFLPYRFLVLVLTRFFAFFPEPESRNRELLSRWFWLAVSRAPELNLSGSTANTRSLAGLVVPGDEHQSIGNLLNAVQLPSPLAIPDIRRFSTRHASGKIALCALWSIGPEDPVTSRAYEPAQLAESLVGRETPAEVALELFNRDRLDRHLRLSVGNRLLAPLRDDTRATALIDLDADVSSSTLASHLVSAASLDALASGDRNLFVSLREDAVRRLLSGFLRTRTGEGLEQTPSLSAMDLDDEFDEEYDDDSYFTDVARDS